VHHVGHLPRINTGHLPTFNIIFTLSYHCHPAMSNFYYYSEQTLFASVLLTRVASLYSF